MDEATIQANKDQFDRTYVPIEVFCDTCKASHLGLLRRTDLESVAKPVTCAICGKQTARIVGTDP